MNIISKVWRIVAGNQHQDHGNNAADGPSIHTSTLDDELQDIPNAGSPTASYEEYFKNISVELDMPERFKYVLASKVLTKDAPTIEFSKEIGDKVKHALETIFDHTQWNSTENLIAAWEVFPDELKKITFDDGATNAATIYKQQLLNINNISHKGDQITKEFAANDSKLPGDHHTTLNL